jgi:hypothetical protein
LPGDFGGIAKAQIYEKRREIDSVFRDWVLITCISKMDAAASKYSYTVR